MKIEELSKEELIAQIYKEREYNKLLLTAISNFATKLREEVKELRKEYEHE